MAKKKKVEKLEDEFLSGVYFRCNCGEEYLNYDYVNKKYDLYKKGPRKGEVKYITSGDNKGKPRILHEIKEVEFGTEHERVMFSNSISTYVKDGFSGCDLICCGSCGATYVDTFAVKSISSLEEAETLKKEVQENFWKKVNEN